jgi:predicted nucleic acid-binding protein
MRWQELAHGIRLQRATVDVTRIRRFVPFASDTIAAAVRFYKARDDKDWSLTDCLSLVV